MKREDLAKLPAGTLLMTKNRGHRGTQLRFEGMGSGGYYPRYGNRELIPIVLAPTGALAVVVHIHPLSDADNGRRTIEPREIEGLWVECDAAYTAADAAREASYARRAADEKSRKTESDALVARASAVGVPIAWFHSGWNISSAQLATGLSQYNRTFVCFEHRTRARSRFLASFFTGVPRCPKCRAPMVRLHFSSKTPSARDDAGWKALEDALRKERLASEARSLSAAMKEHHVRLRPSWWLRLWS